MIAGSPWTDPVVDRLRALISAGASYSGAAKTLSSEFRVKITRNAVCAKVDRLNIAQPPKPAPPSRVLRVPEAKPEPITLVANLTRAIATGPAPASLAYGTPEHQARVDAIARAPKTIDDPAFGGCRWPLYRTAPDGQTLHCCNAREAAPYCAEHRALAFTRGAA
jgi:hypothetical protein